MYPFLLLCLQTVSSQPFQTEGGSWGQQHSRDSVLVLPSSDGSSSLKIEDLPQNNQWNFVEFNSNNDLQQAEYRSNSLESQKVLPWSQDGLTQQVKLVDDRLYAGQENVDWAWSTASDFNRNTVEEQPQSNNYETIFGSIERVDNPPQQQLSSTPHVVRNQPPPPPPTAPPSPSPTTLSSNPLTRLKQRLANAVSSPVSSWSDNIKAAINTIASPDRTGAESYGQSQSDTFNVDLDTLRSSIKTYLGLPQTISTKSLNTEPIRSKIVYLKDKMSSLFQKGKDAVISSTSGGYNAPAPTSQTYHQESPSYGEETVTDSPIPVPVPTLLPLTSNAEFSPGFQLLVQYVAAMVGMAFILAI